MRVAVLTRFGHVTGGIETYLETVLPGLAERGHHVDVWHEAPLAADRRPLVTHAGISVTPIGRSADAVEQTVREIQRRRTEVVFSQSIDDVRVERRIASLAPTIVLLHAYYGACISGYKTFQFPRGCPCERALGPGCLVRYHARHCGGWSPMSMVRSYNLQRAR
jgi:hypothetical protein